MKLNIIRTYDLSSFTTEIQCLFEYILNKFGDDESFLYSEENGVYQLYDGTFPIDEEALEKLDQLVEWCLS